jgi:hypothetical protein
MNKSGHSGFRDVNPRDVKSDAGLLSSTLYPTETRLDGATAEYGRLTAEQRLALLKPTIKATYNWPANLMYASFNVLPIGPIASPTTLLRGYYDKASGNLYTWTTTDLINWVFTTTAIGAGYTMSANFLTSNSGGCWTGSEFLLVFGDDNISTTKGFFSATGQGSWTSFTIHASSFMSQGNSVAVTATKIMGNGYDYSYTIAKPLTGSPTVTLLPPLQNQGLTSLGPSSQGAVVMGGYYTEDLVTLTPVIPAFATSVYVQETQTNIPFYIARASGSFSTYLMLSSDGISWRTIPYYAPSYIGDMFRVQSADGHPIYVSRCLASLDLSTWYTYDTEQLIADSYGGALSRFTFKNSLYEWRTGFSLIRQLELNGPELSPSATVITANMLGSTQIKL